MLWIAAVLGIVEGLTEYLPVSSTGHLILAGHLFHYTGEAASTFEIFIQLGAILAVVLLFWPKFQGMLSFKKEGFAGVKGIQILAVTTAPALILGVLLHHFIKEHLFNPVTVAIGLGLGGIWLIVIEKILPRAQKTGLDNLNYRDAVLIGLFQCLAMWPGVSRSAATILGAMMIGIDRKTAAEFSFFAAVPVLAAATGLDLVKSLHALHGSDLPFFAVGFILSFVSAYLTVGFFIRYISKNSLKVFGWYRIAVAGAVLLLMR